MTLPTANIFNLLPILLIVGVVVLFSHCQQNPVAPPAVTDEEQILFIRQDIGVSEICTILPDGSDIRVITHYEKGDDYISQKYLTAKWSSDKSRMVVSGGPGTAQEYNPVWLLDHSGIPTQRLTLNGDNPIWSPFDDSVLYSRRRGYFSLTADIYRVNIATLVEDTLLWAEVGTAGPGSGYMYVLSDAQPIDDSKFLALEFYIYKDSLGRSNARDADIIMYDNLSQEKEYLSENATGEGSCRISPDGQSIAYAALNEGLMAHSNNIFIMKVDGSNVRQLTTSTATRYHHLVWSPDGNNLVFLGSDQSAGWEGGGDLFIHHIQTGLSDTLLVQSTEKMQLMPMDWK